MVKQLLRGTGAALSCAALSGCFLEVIVPRGGDVTSLSTNNDCAEGNNCAIEILDTTFTETFTAEPKEGFVFRRWMEGDDFNCGGSTVPVCTVSNTLFAGNALVELLIPGSFQTWYVMPVFEFEGIDTDGDGTFDRFDDDDDNDGVLDVDDGCPLDPLRQSFCDTVFVAGTEWAQPDLFYDLSWNQITAVCPVSGMCTVGGTLNGLDMTNWRFASLAEVNGLFNVYISPLVMGPGPDQYNQLNSTVVLPFFLDGFRGRETTSPTDLITLTGMTSTTVSGDNTRVYIGRVTEVITFNFVDSFQTDGTFPKVNMAGTVGAFFYRVP